MHATYTEKDFQRLSWHDSYVYGIKFPNPDIDVADWRSDLVFDIDYIVEWILGVDRSFRFLVSPADLIFHGVTDLRLSIDWADSFQTAVPEIWIDGIKRDRIRDQKIYLDRPYYRWAIELVHPPGGEIAFGAVGFTQVLRAEPLLIDEQKLKPAQRPPLPAG